MTDSKKKKILFLCTGNAARSQMSEALARIDYPDLIEPVSAGSRAAGFVHPLAVRAIEELGFGMDAAYSKPAADFFDAKLDLVVTVCDSAAADCPTWPGARHIVNWSVEDPSFVTGDEAVRLAAFRATRDDLRKRIDGLMEALRRSVPKRTDAELLGEGAGILDGVLREHGFKFDGVSEEKTGHRAVAVGHYARRGRTLELQVRSGVAIALYTARERRMLHPDYMECLGASGAMRYPGLSKDPLDAFRRLRADLVRFGGPFLTGKGLKDFERFFDARQGKKGPARSA
ncbi:MAG TPA: arsenate reductase ArsC [Thermoanaerobaculia bacterium]|jgi:arsenate reductase|nr:arsenate reductase ArsC [Thermoanaerobaculia bacterium]